MKLLFLLALTGLAASSLAGCSSPDVHYDVMATFYPLQFLTQRIAGPDLAVGVVVKPGVEPHDHEATPQDLVRIHDAKALVIQGASFESWLRTAQAQAPETRLIVATEGIDLRENPDKEEAATLPRDPHTWLDPVLAQNMTRTIQGGLAAAFPQRSTDLASNADALVADLAKLDGEYRAGLANCTTRYVVTNHAAFAYMGARYGFTQIPIAGLDPESEPDAQTIKRVVDEARAHNVTIIFFEDLVSPKVAESIAKEVGGATRVLSPLESVAGANDYFSVMRADLAALQDGMKCSR